MTTKTQTQPEKKAFFIDEWKITKSIDNADSLVAIINRFLQKAKEVELEPNQELYEGFVSRGASFIINELTKKAEEAYLKSGIRSESLRKEMLNTVQHDSQPFEGLDQSFKRAIYSSIPSNMGFEETAANDIEITTDGTAILKPEAIDRFKNNSTVNIDTPQKKEFWQLLSNLAESYNKFEAFAAEFEFGGCFEMTPDGLVYDFFTKDGEFKIKPNPMAIKLINS